VTGGYHRSLAAAARRAEPRDVPQEARSRGAEMLAKVDGRPASLGDTDSVGGWHIETHTLGCRNAADEPEGEWLDSHWRIFDEYAADPNSVVVGDPDGGAAFLTFTRGAGL
jgi:hypothetical protein